MVRIGQEKPDANRLFVEELRRQLKFEIEIRELDMYLNTPEFALAVVEAFEEMMKESRTVGLSIVISYFLSVVFH